MDKLEEFDGPRGVTPGEDVVRDCGGYAKNPFQTAKREREQNADTCFYEFVFEFFKNYRATRLNTFPCFSSEAIPIMVGEVKKMCAQNGRMLHTVFSVRRTTKLELMNIVEHQFSDENYCWEKIVEIFAIAIVLYDISQSRIDIELEYDVQDMLFYTFKRVQNWFLLHGSWKQFVKYYTDKKQ